MAGESSSGVSRCSPSRKVLMHGMSARNTTLAELPAEGNIFETSYWNIIVREGLRLLLCHTYVTPMPM